MTPRKFQVLAGVANNPRQHTVSRQARSFVKLTRIDVGSTRVAGGVDDKFRFLALQKRDQFIPVAIIDLLSGYGTKWQIETRELLSKGASDVSAAAKQDEHIELIPWTLAI